jgi:hypothetical protein
VKRFLLKSYRTLVPNKLKRRLSPELKNRVLDYLLYLTARPGVTNLHLRQKANSAERRGVWDEAMQHWQHMALLSHPDRSSDDPAGPPVTLTLPNASEDDDLRKTRYALTGLRRARAKHALELYSKGQDRVADALVCQVIESLPDHRILKNDPIILEAASCYLRRALRHDGAKRIGSIAKSPKCIVLCVDVLKFSNVHTHARVMFSICKNLLDLDPELTAHVVVTYERFVVTTPIVAHAFNPNRTTKIETMARASFGDLFGTRFHLHVLNSYGLEGVLETCKEILKIGPDVMLYGGGHSGFFSNESRLVRHTLFDQLPSAFWYIQSNNQVDSKLDMIIARGPHAISGDFGKARVRVQPYPTIISSEAEDPPPEILPHKRQSKIIVSAINGIRMNQRLAQQDRGTIEVMLSILDKVPGSVWHFIGSADPMGLARDIPLIEKRIKQGQLIVHPSVPFAEFTQRVKGAALFVHPPGFTGGSGGAAVARAAGIPILTCKDSDVSGRQPLETVFDANDMGGLARKAAELLSEDAPWAEAVRRQNEHKSWIRETSSAGFYECLTETVNAFGTRSGRR